MSVAAELLAASDPPDLEAWGRMAAENIHLRIANRNAVLGREAAVAELAILFDKVAALGRGFREIWPAPDGETILMELDLLPLCSDRPIPLALVVRAAPPCPLLRDLRFCLDPGPLRLE